LHRIADAEARKSSENGKGGGENHGKLRELRTHTILDVIHRPADEIAELICLAIGDRADGLGIFRGHADKGDHPHVEKRAGTAPVNRGRNAGNIACAHSGCERGCKRLERRNLTLAARRRERGGEAFRYSPPGHEAQADDEIEPDTANGDEHRPAPEKIVELTYKVLKCLNCPFTRYARLFA